MKDLSAYMSKAIATLALDAMRVAARNPAQLGGLQRFAANLGRAQRLRGESERSGLHVPPFLIASITTDCNLACAGCYARANNACGSQTGGYLSAEKWSSLFTEAESLGVCFILLAGGEPLLRRDVLEVAAGYEHILFPVFTNGTLADDGLLRLLERGRNLLPIVSLEGDAVATDARRGAGVYGRVAAFLRRLKAHGILFGASITVTRDNLQLVTDVDFVKGLRREGCRILFYVEYVPADGESGEWALDEEGRAVLEERIEPVRRMGGLVVLSFPGDEALSGGCLAAGRGFVHINSAGGVEPCPFSPYSDVSIGQVSLQKALRSPFLSRIRDFNLTEGRHAGGCVLFDKREQVERLLER